MKRQASGRFFEKKLRKKLLLLAAQLRHAGLGPASTSCALSSPTPLFPGAKVFLLLFFQKKQFFLK
jgi:hypothetical protein